MGDTCLVLQLHPTFILENPDLACFPQWTSSFFLPFFSLYSSRNSCIYCSHHMHHTSTVPVKSWDTFSHLSQLTKACPNFWLVMYMDKAQGFRNFNQLWVSNLIAYMQLGHFFGLEQQETSGHGRSMYSLHYGHSDILGCIHWQVHSRYMPLLHFLQWVAPHSLWCISCWVWAYLRIVICQLNDWQSFFQISLSGNIRASISP